MAIEPIAQGGTSPQRSEFFAVQEADQRLEANLEEEWLATTRLFYIPDMDFEQLKLPVIGIIEGSRNFLYKYLMPNDHIMVELDNTLRFISNNTIPKEILFDVFSKRKAECMITFGGLGFRKQKVPSYMWTNKLAQNAQIPADDKNVQAIFSKKK